MNVNECPEKLLIRERYPRRKITLYHEWKWERVGKDKDGADLREGVCRLCGYKVGVIRFCSRCGLRIDGPWKGEGSLCWICIGQDDRVLVE